ncbi:hypothetical protein [Streptomyces sp900116325]|uniref:hypothetical protein n=1 Tax=Streptomyces sp. 900116325 TaxID=3154295 RepID=UPI00331DBCDB
MATHLDEQTLRSAGVQRAAALALTYADRSAVRVKGAADSTGSRRTSSRISGVCRRQPR